MGHFLGTFRPAVRPTLQSVGAPAAGIVLVLAGLGAVRGRPVEEVAVWGFVGFLLLAAAMVATTWLVSRLCPVHVYQHGLRASGLTSWSAAIKWRDVAALELFSANGMPYVRLVPKGNERAVYVPVAVLLNPEFGRLVAAQAGHDHPLTRAIHAAR